jgi:3-oxoacyl-[acyl-carrier protein] reductase
MSEPTTRVALVTGASRGIGRAIAVQLAHDGWDVGFCYRQADAAAAAVRDLLTAQGRRVFVQRCDVSDFEAARQFLEAAEGALGPADLLVNCAGIVRDNPLVLMDRASWDAVIDANLGSTFNVCRHAVFGFMKRRRGCIINISSVAGVAGNPTQANYSASKAGIIGFSSALAKEVGPYGIRVNVVAPGFITTDMTAELSPKVVEKHRANIPLGRLGTPPDVAELVGFLGSEKAAYITGQTIRVDGGLTL